MSSFSSVQAGCIALKLFQRHKTRCNRKCTVLSDPDEDVYLSQFCSDHYQFTRPFYHAYKAITNFALNTYKTAIQKSTSDPDQQDKTSLMQTLRCAYGRLSIAIQKRSHFMQQFIMPECHNRGHVDFLKSLQAAQRDCDVRLTQLRLEKQVVQSAVAVNVPSEERSEPVDDDSKRANDDDEPTEPADRKKKMKRSVARRKYRQRLAVRKFLDDAVLQAEQEHSEIRSIFTSSFEPLHSIGDELLTEHILPLIASGFIGDGKDKQQEEEVWQLCKWSDLEINESKNSWRVKSSFVCSNKTDNRSDNKHRDDQDRYLFLSPSCMDNLLIMSSLGDFFLLHLRLMNLRSKLKQQTFTKHLSLPFKGLILDIFDSCQVAVNMVITLINPSELTNAYKSYVKGETVPPLSESFLNFTHLFDIFRRQFIPNIIHALTDCHATVEDARWFSEQIMRPTDIKAVWLKEMWSRSHKVTQTFVRVGITFRETVAHFNSICSEMVHQSRTSMEKHFDFQLVFADAELETLQQHIVWYADDRDELVPIFETQMPMFQSKLSKQSIAQYVYLMRAIMNGKHLYSFFLALLLGDIETIADCLYQLVDHPYARYLDSSLISDSDSDSDVDVDSDSSENYNNKSCSLMVYK